MSLTVSEILGTLLSKVLADQKDAMNGRLEERAHLAESILETVKLLRKEMEELGI